MEDYRMWNPSDSNSFPTASANEPPPKAATTTSPDFSNGPSMAKAQSQAVIGKSIVVKGEITGAESLHIHGRVEGSIDLASHYVHIGPDAIVMSNITARELVVRGTLHGNTTLDDRLDIRTGGSLTGDVSAKRISIADGAHFKGRVDMRRTESKVNPGLATQSNPEKKKDVAPVLNATDTASTGS
jgi:cytoskeletal protein CcmA (bactofilin family)